MNSRKIITYISFLVLIFTFHLLLYYSISWYTSFFKKVKYEWISLNWEKQVKNEVKEVFSTYSWSLENNWTWWNSILTNNSWLILNDNKTWSLIINLDKVNISNSSTKVKPEEKIVIWDTEKKILDLFKNFDLVELENHSSLFDLTTEYPDRYLEYIWKDNTLTVYIFNWKNYNDLYNIFDVISYNLPFKIKWVNNFWEASFYINLNKEVEDNFTRLVINYKKVIFWLKIKKDVYNNVKDVLKNLK